MKYKNFVMLLAWLMFFTSGKSLLSCIALGMVGVYWLVDAIVELKRIKAK